jgi:hypothetical protein
MNSFTLSLVFCAITRLEAKSKQKSSRRFLMQVSSELVKSENIFISAGLVLLKIFCHSSILKNHVINLAFDFYTKQIYPAYVQFKDVR